MKVQLVSKFSAMVRNFYQNCYKPAARFFEPVQQFTGTPGQYVPLKETLRGFKMILDGECDQIPESCFLFAGTIDDVYEKAKQQQ